MCVCASGKGGSKHVSDDHHSKTHAHYNRTHHTVLPFMVPESTIDQGGTDRVKTAESPLVVSPAPAPTPAVPDDVIPPFETVDGAPKQAAADVSIPAKPEKSSVKTTCYNFVRQTRSFRELLNHKWSE